MGDLNGRRVTESCTRNLDSSQWFFTLVPSLPESPPIWPPGLQGPQFHVLFNLLLNLCLFFLVFKEGAAHSDPCGDWTSHLGVISLPLQPPELTGHPKFSVWCFLKTNATGLLSSDTDLIGFDDWYLCSLLDDFKVHWRLRKFLLK